MARTAGCPAATTSRRLRGIATIADLALAPVKGLRLTGVEELDLRPSGPAGDRAFLVVDAANGEIVLTSRTPRLLEVEPGYAEGVLTLRFPDGTEVAERPEPGPASTTGMYDGRVVRGRLVDGALAQALSEHLGRDVRLLAREPDDVGADDAPVTLMSRASLEALAPALDGTVPDPRRFRMSIAIDGVAAWEEHSWAGRRIAAGDAVLEGIDPVPRCVVTTRDPESGRRDAPVLAALARLRGKHDVTFGLWCRVVSPGPVRLGDPVAVEPA